MLDRKIIDNLRADFPMLNDEVIYFDNAATTFKPHTVINAVMDYYTQYSYNVGRSDYLKAFSVEQQVEKVRELVAGFINAQPNEIIFTSGTTASLNLFAFSYGLQNLKPGDVVLTSKAEHASSLLPWFKVCEMSGATIEYVDINMNGDLTIESFKKAMHDKVKIVVLAAITNVLGNILPIAEISQVVHEYDAVLMCDGAQSVPHMVTDVMALDVDFMAFSAHKMLGPTGVGILYGKQALLEDLNPYFQGGGSNSRYNEEQIISYKSVPYKFENGTLPIESILGFGAAIEYLNEHDFKLLMEYEYELNQYFIGEMLKLENVTVYNPQQESGIVAFNVKGIFSQDVATYLDSQKIMVRSGHHCSKLLNQVISAEDTVRASVYFYNTKDEVDRFIEVLKDTTLEKCIGVFA